MYDLRKTLYRVDIVYNVNIRQSRDIKDYAIKVKQLRYFYEKAKKGVMLQKKKRERNFYLMRKIENLEENMKV